jgi:predicted dienelactone hydrolase
MNFAFLKLFNPYTWAALAAAAVVALSLSFGGGYYLAVNQAEQNASAATAKAVKAQELQDLEQHQGAVAENSIAVARKTKGKTVIKTIIEMVPEIQFVDKECNITPEMIRLMNQAGHQ